MIYQKRANSTKIKHLKSPTVRKLLRCIWYRIFTYGMSTAQQATLLIINPLRKRSICVI